ncbi:hypothetical protein [Leptotrichia sp. OH3620_COT-345]|uniref:hypothetical protein n=1 Tax=Leptotrichia sp. OH3620_COT-345 TaxID=2491048 RepID=UPI0013151B47|nr:hypothetical protein [Leptotrichia sp. OH3620_COT-345]
MKTITEEDVKKSKLENKAMSLRREQLEKEDRELFKKINKNIELIQKWERICKK